MNDEFKNLLKKNREDLDQTMRSSSYYQGVIIHEQQEYSLEHFIPSRNLTREETQQKIMRVKVMKELAKFHLTSKTLNKQK